MKDYIDFKVQESETKIGVPLKSLIGRIEEYIKGLPEDHSLFKEYSAESIDEGYQKLQELGCNMTQPADNFLAIYNLL